MPDISTELLNTDESAVFLHIPVSTLRYWIQKGTICRSVRIGRRRYFRRADLEKFIADKFNDPVSA